MTARAAVRTIAGVTRVLYFGAGLEPGHCLTEEPPPGRRALPLPSSLQPARLDGGFAPEGEETQGVARMSQVDGWTVLSWWDRSGDTRRGSSSTILVDSYDVSLEAVLALAAERFPGVMQRQPVHIRLDPAEWAARVGEVSGRLWSALESLGGRS